MPLDFVHGHNNKGHHTMGGLQRVEKDGHYRWIILCRDGSRCYFARAVMEAELKRQLRTWEHVHHINQDPEDDRPENLELVSIWKHGQIHSGKISSKVMLDTLRCLAEDLGHAPTMDDCNESTITPHSDTYRKRFRSWKRALRQAGISEETAQPQHRASLRYFGEPDELLLGKLRSLAEKLGHPPTGEDIDADPSMPSSRTYYARFGGVPAARRKAGIVS